MEAEEGGLPADRVRDERGARSPEPQQVRGDICRPGDDGARLGGGRPEIDVAPGIRGEHCQ